MVLPSDEDLEIISTLFLHLQQADSPLEKLEYLLKAISLIFHSVSYYYILIRNTGRLFPYFFFFEGRGRRGFPDYFKFR